MSILDQVRKNQLAENLSGFNPVLVLNTLLSRLSEKEKEVIKKRFGLYGQKYTLEEIGKEYGITRERVRQIENLSIKKLKELEELKDDIQKAERVVTQLIDNHGGIMEESYFLENILSYLENAEDNIDNAMLFLAEYIFSDNVVKIKSDKIFHPVWQSGLADFLSTKEVVSQIIGIIQSYNKPMKLEDILSAFKQSDFYQQNKEKIISNTSFLEVSEEDVDKIIESYMRTSRQLKPNLFNEWGLISWGTVQPKRINDKIYLVMKKTGKPMHFREIADAINEVGFDNKVAYAPTVHNELILDDKYILVGRGIYALKEWGYKPGSVSDIIEQLLKENGPMTKEQIINQVLDQRDVKKSTIYLSLMNNKNITKTGDKYQFVDSE